MTYALWIMIIISSAGSQVVPGHYTSGESCIEARNQMQEISNMNVSTICVPVETWNTHFNSRAK